jgi:hypothetical protein
MRQGENLCPHEKGLRLAGAAALMAFAVWLVLAAPGFLTVSRRSEHSPRLRNNPRSPDSNKGN